MEGGGGDEEGEGQTLEGRLICSWLDGENRLKPWK